MCVAYNEIPPEKFVDWDKRYREASKAVGKRQEQMDA